MADYPAPDDPSPRAESLRLTASGHVLEAMSDPYSDRLRCDHPEVEACGVVLGRALRAEAVRRDHGRVVVLAPSTVAEGLEEVGFVPEATMPGFYEGEVDCAVMRLALDDSRASLANPVEVARVEALLAAPRAPKPAPELETLAATRDDAAEIAALIADTFAQYPTPSGVADYISDAIAEGTPFRLVRDQGEIVACASADLVPEARTAELTDCATRPSHRGQGLMQAILSDLMDDLREMEYPTAFTLARARIPGVNLAFQRLGFELRGCMTRSCRIGDGLEDMNVWSRSLQAA